jgi:hypothetical protein
MKKIITIFAALALCLSFSFAGPKKAAGPVNENCPFSGNAIDKEQTVELGVCCGNCAKKAAKDIKGTIAKAKGDFTKCPFSGKDGKKKVTVGFCCPKCKGKASAKG